MAVAPWRSGIPEVVVLAGSTLAIGGNLVALVTPPGDASAVTLHILGLAAGAAMLVLLLVRRKRTPRHFVLLAGVATVAALLTFAGLPGGAIALAGAVWGLLATYEPLPRRG